MEVRSHPSSTAARHPLDPATCARRSPARSRSRGPAWPLACVPPQSLTRGVHPSSPTSRRLRAELCADARVRPAHALLGVAHTPRCAPALLKPPSHPLNCPPETLVATELYAPPPKPWRRSRPHATTSPSTRSRPRASLGREQATGATCVRRRPPHRRDDHAGVSPPPPSAP
jgi:hypothetical protein